MYTHVLIYMYCIHYKCDCVKNIRVIEYHMLYLCVLLNC